jgi:hypothetical protein
VALVATPEKKPTDVHETVRANVQTLLFTGVIGAYTELHYLITATGSLARTTSDLRLARRHVWFGGWQPKVIGFQRIDNHGDIN